MIDLIEKKYSEIGIGASEILMCEVYRYYKSIHMMVFLGYCCYDEQGAIEIKLQIPVANAIASIIYYFIPSLLPFLSSITFQTLAALFDCLLFIVTRKTPHGGTTDGEVLFKTMANDFLRKASKLVEKTNKQTTSHIPSHIRYFYHITIHPSIHLPIYLPTYLPIYHAKFNRQITVSPQRK